MSAVERRHLGVPRKPPVSLMDGYRPASLEDHAVSAVKVHHGVQKERPVTVVDRFHSAVAEENPATGAEEQHSVMAAAGFVAAELVEAGDLVEMVDAAADDST